MKICKVCHKKKPHKEFRPCYYKNKMYREKTCNLCDRIAKVKRNRKLWAEKRKEMRALGRFHNSKKLKNNGDAVRKYARKRNKTLKGIAGWMLRDAVKRGRIIKPSSCSQCDSKENIHGHHDDYSKPLKVRWLCSVCHRKHHRVRRVEEL